MARRELETVSPSELFEAACAPARAAELQRMGMNVVARPGEPVPSGVGRDDIVVRHCEGKLAVVAAVEGAPASRAALEARGVPCEGSGEGLFVEVHPAAGGRPRVGRMIAGPDGSVRRDTAVVRRGTTVPAESVPAPALDGARHATNGARPAANGARPAASGARMPSAPPVEEDASVRAMVLEAVLALRARRRRTLREDDLRALLGVPAGATGEALQRAVAVAELDQRLRGPAGSAGHQELLDALAEPVLAAAERQFILDVRRSTLELLEPGERDRYLRFAWDPDDFPGGATGPNEARAEHMFAALSRLRPERRANQGEAAVVRRDEFDAAMQRRIADALVPVPEERGQQLLRDAAEAYVRMRTAAAGEGVTLAIGSSYRPAARAAANAARAGNPAAVASFSSHTLGLAVDLRMSQGGLRIAEAVTRPFQNVVDMYRSPVHKWMFLRAEEHGWFPYRREPWHWECNPLGFRAHLRQADAEGAAAAAPRGDAGAAEVATDPVAPLMPALALRGSVGRGGRNRAADVRAVQDRLVALRELAAADAASERPAGSGTVAEASLGATVAAIESFQRHLGLPANGAVDDAQTRLDLDRAIPLPTAAELTAVATRRAAIGQAVSRGLAIGGPVGAVATGNAPADVGAVQRRLVDLGRLAASHGEAPPAGAAAHVPAASLGRTIAAIRAFQRDVRFWAGRGTVHGAITNGVVAPGDATAALLDRVAVFELTSGTDRIRLQDHVVSGVTASERGVRFTGTASPAAIPTADYVALGLTAAEAAALQFVSRHEGNFDAINTYDVARVSAGFIQFAGGRGLPPYLALLKSRNATRFRSLLQELGIDVEFAVGSGHIRSARVVVLDPAASRVLRAVPAEEAIRDDKRLTAALILSGRDRDVQLVQIEAAIRDYVVPSLDGRVSWGSASAPLRDLVRTERGMAMLFDRAVQEGVGTARTRFERVIRALHARSPAATVADLQAREADVLAELERDLTAGADVAARIAEARALLATLAEAAGAAAPATVLARPELVDARGKVSAARTRVADVVNAAPSRGSTIDATLATMAATLRAEDARLAFTPPPATGAALEGALSSSRLALATAAAPVARCEAFLRRIADIRTSGLAAATTPPAGTVEHAPGAGPATGPAEGFPREVTA